ncbi:MAG: phage protein Gp27 family protein, partial [Arsenophonus sp. NC-QC1-MAG3]
MKGAASVERTFPATARRFDAVFFAIREATEMIRVITEGAEDEQDKFSEAIIASIEVNILTAIINVCEANHEEMELVECTF